MVADLFEVSVEGCAFLLSVNGTFSGIYDDDEPPFVSTPKEDFGGPAGSTCEGFKALACWENLVLEQAECGLAGAAFMFLPQICSV